MRGYGKNDGVRPPGGEGRGIFSASVIGKIAQIQGNVVPGLTGGSIKAHGGCACGLDLKIDGDGLLRIIAIPGVPV